MPLSDEVRRELAAIDPRRDCDRLAELSGLFHTAGQPPPAAATATSRSTSTSPSRRPPAARSASCERSGSRPRSGRTRSSAFDGRDAVPDPRARRRAAAPRARPRAACCPARTRRSSRRRSGSSEGLLPERLPARRLPRRRVGERAALAAPRDPDGEPRRGRAGRGRRRAGGCPAAGSRPRPSRGRIRQGRRADRRRAGADGRGDTALSLDEHAVVAEARARANRVANADHANLVRTSRAAHAPDPRDQAARGGRTARPALAAAREIAELRLRYPSASLRELAAKCRPPATKAAAHRRLDRLIALASANRSRHARSFWSTDGSYSGGGSALVRRWIQTPSAG